MGDDGHPGPDRDVELVTVFSPGDSGTIAIAKSLLQGEGIEFFVRGEEVQDLFGWGRFPNRSNLVAGPMQIQVRGEDTGNARTLLSTLASDREDEV